MEEILFYKMAWQSIKWSYAQVIHFLHFDKNVFNNYTLRASDACPKGKSKASEASRVDNRENSVKINLTKTEKQDIILSALFKR